VVLITGLGVNDYWTELLQSTKKKVLGEEAI